MAAILCLTFRQSQSSQEATCYPPPRERRNPAAQALESMTPGHDGTQNKVKPIWRLPVLGLDLAVGRYRPSGPDQGTLRGRQQGVQQDVAVVACRGGDGERHERRPRSDKSENQGRRSPFAVGNDGDQRDDPQRHHPDDGGHISKQRGCSARRSKRWLSIPPRTGRSLPKRRETCCPRKGSWQSSAAGPRCRASRYCRFSRS